ncbi:MAG: hypothetical protein QOJ90_2537 [Actinomycetota bacterium]|jgi:hypothetical protein|nr:hypothetical protein [Actinomycetota bacterium]MDQ1643186.1 hypothetical protein [Actinomycetota bacterium]
MEYDEEARLVRPYTLTRGRTRSGSAHLPLEALVRGVPGVTATPASPEHGRILALVSAQILSVVEVSAHLSLPLGVVRVLIGDLAGDGLVIVHTGSNPATQTPQAHLKVLESVLDGISAL